MSKLISLLLSAAVLAPVAACVDDAAEDAPTSTTTTAAAVTSQAYTVPMTLVSRRVAPTSSQARVVVDTRTLDLITQWTSTTGSIEVREAGALRMKVAKDAAGVVRFTNHANRTYRQAEVQANPALAEQFDSKAMLLFIPEVFKLTSGVEPAAVPPLVIPAGAAGYFIGWCLSESHIDYDSDTGWDVSINWDCPLF